MKFNEYISNFRNTWGAMTAVALIVAATLKFTSLVPPWPDEAGFGASALAVFACIIGLASGFFLPLSDYKTKRILGIILVILSLFFTITYLYLMSLNVVTFVQPINDVEAVRRIIVGNVTIDALDALKSSVLLIETYGPDPARIWTIESVTNARITLLSCYIGIFFSLTFGLGCLQSSESNKNLKPRSRN